MAQTDTAPGEQGGKTGKSQEPVEDVTAAGADVDIGDRTKDQDGENGEQGSTRLVDVGEASGSESGFSHGGQRSGTGVDARETDGKDRDTDGGVDEVVETLDAGSLEDEDEGRGGGVVAAASQETFVGVGNKETDDGQRGDVDDRDSPEGLLDWKGSALAQSLATEPGGLTSSGHGLSRVGSFRRSQTDKFSSGEREGGGNKDGADTLEAVGEGSGFLPDSSTDVGRVRGTGRTATADEDDTCNDALVPGSVNLRINVPAMMNIMVTSNFKQELQNSSSA